MLKMNLGNAYIHMRVMLYNSYILDLYMRIIVENVT